MDDGVPYQQVLEHMRGLWYLITACYSALYARQMKRCLDVSRSSYFITQHYELMDIRYGALNAKTTATSESYSASLYGANLGIKPSRRLSRSPTPSPMSHNTLRLVAAVFADTILQNLSIQDLPTWLHY